jgi:uncharacterized protein
VYAQANESSLFHLRNKSGDREVDLIVERSDHKIFGFEVKLSREVSDHDVRHLRSLKENLVVIFSAEQSLPQG